MHPRGDPNNPLTGVFLTRSPEHPNPHELHRAKVLENKAGNLLMGPIEAIDRAPMLDIKLVVEEANDF